MQLNPAKKQNNKFGTMWYLNERLYLKKSTNSVTNYGTWLSDDSKLYVVLNYDANLKEELENIMDTMIKSTPELSEFKRSIEGDRHFIKAGAKLEKIEAGMAMRYIIEIYGVFTKTSDKKSYLQMEVSEVAMENFNLL